MAQHQDRDNLEEEDREELIAQATDDFMDAMREGPAPDVKLFAAKYPSVRDDLVLILPALSAMTDDEPSSASFDVNNRERLGDFLIRRPIGRGGMGIVYEAEQLSLGRTVALKVLPFAAMLDEQHRNRFRNEARAAATLNHQNIVPIYSVGVERGVHYFAMQLIDGQTLAEIIAQVKASTDTSGTSAIRTSRVSLSENDASVTSRTRSEESIQDPIDSPTEVFEVSRDTETIARLSTQWSRESANYFKTVATFGLQAARAIDHAHEQGVLHRDIKPGNMMVDRDGKLWVTDFGLARLDTGVSITASGDIVGTLRYMSPEQALGRRGIVDQRTDVYSLGATLYELLTLRPAMDGADRAELLTQIASHHPTPVRRLAPQAPIELQTIVQKAMEKNPEHRYPSAQDLADDLDRFLKQQPIEARPPRVHEQAAKWALRHPGRIIAAALVFLLLAVGLSVSTLIIARERERADQALIAERSQRQRADANLRLARETIDQAFTQEAKNLEDMPQMTERQRDFFEKVVTFYEDLPKAETNAPEIRAENAIAYERLARVHGILGSFTRARQSYEKAITTYEGLGPASVAGTDLLADHIRCLVAASDIAREIPDLEYARSLLVDAQEKINASAADQDFYPDRSRHFVKENLAVTEHRLAIIDERLGDETSARERFREAIRIKSLLCLEAPEELDYLHDVANIAIDFGRFLVLSRGDVEAMEWYEAAEQRALALSRAENKSVRSRELLADIKNAQALLHRHLGDYQSARKALEAAINGFTPLAADYPQRPAYQNNLRGTYENLGIVLFHLGDAAQSETILRTSLRLAVELCERYPETTKFKESLAGSYSNLAKVLQVSEAKEERKELTHKALIVWKELAEATGNEPRILEKLALGYYSYAAQLSPAEAMPILETASRQLVPLVANYPDVPSYRDRLSILQATQAETFVKLELYPQAIQSYDELFVTTSQLVERWPNVPDYQMKLAKQFALVAELHFQLKDYELSVASFKKAIEQQQNTARLFPDFKPATGNKSRSRLQVALANALDARLSEMGGEGNLERQSELVTQLENELAASLSLAANLCISGNAIGWLLNTDDFQQLSLRNRAEFFERADQIFAQKPPQHRGVWPAKRLATLINQCNMLADEKRWADCERIIERAIPVAEDVANDFPRIGNALVWIQIARWPNSTRWVAKDVPSSECLPLRIAQINVAASPSSASSWNTLGYVHIIRDDFDQAIEALRNAIRYRNGGNEYDWALMALCSAKQGDKFEAERWLLRLHNEASEKLESDEDLRRIERKVADVLANQNDQPEDES